MSERDGGVIRPTAGGTGPDLRWLQGPLPPSLPRPSRPRYMLAAALFAITLFSTTTLGAVLYLQSRTDEITDLPLFLGLEAATRVWGDPALLSTGLRLSLPLLFILLCHELGHYFACRHYRLPATLPYFLPAPFALGTLGAFIRIRAYIRRKRELFDVGIAGPIAGFVALLPFLVYGVARSVPAAIVPPEPEAGLGLVLLRPGDCLALTLVSRLFHGPLPADTVLDLHPFALAAWVGLFATALNLLPIGQLDGGHVLYAVFPRLQPRLAPLLWALLALGSFLWPGWLLWCAVVLWLGLRHPPVEDADEPLDRRRRLLAAGALVLFLLSFMPAPLTLVPVGG